MGRNWDGFFMSIARACAAWSKDTSTKVGAVVVGPERQIISTGYNGMPRGVNDEVPARLERPLKYKYFVHGEANAVYNAARHGIATRSCILYVTLVPCANCAQAIIQAGIREVVVAKEGWFPKEYERWQEDWDAACAMLQEAHVILRQEAPNVP